MSSIDRGKARLRQPHGDLYPLVERAFPEHRSVQGVFNVPRFAKDLDVSHETVYRMLRSDTIKLAPALKILKFSREVSAPEERIHWEDLCPFVLPEFKRYSRAHFEAAQESDSFLGIS